MDLLLMSKKKKKMGLGVVGLKGRKHYYKKLLGF